MWHVSHPWLWVNTGCFGRQVPARSLCPNKVLAHLPGKDGMLYYGRLLNSFIWFDTREHMHHATRLAVAASLLFNARHMKAALYSQSGAPPNLDLVQSFQARSAQNKLRAAHLLCFPCDQANIRRAACSAAAGLPLWRACTCTHPQQCLAKCKRPMPTPADHLPSCCIRAAACWSRSNVRAMTPIHPCVDLLGVISETYYVSFGSPQKWVIPLCLCGSWQGYKVPGMRAMIRVQQ